MINLNYQVRGRSCQRAEGVAIESYDLSNCDLLPEYRRIKGNRMLYELSNKYKALKNSIAGFLWSFQPVLVTADGYVLDGQNRLKIMRELWDSGVDAVLLVLTLPFTTDSFNTYKALQEIQKKMVWTPEDKINSLVEKGNETAIFIRILADEPMDFFKSGRFGIRNALVVMGINPDKVDTVPFVLTKEKQDEAEQIFNEIKILLQYGRKEFGRINNWAEAFLKAWRRIRLGMAQEGEDENGVRTVVTPSTLNERIKEIGIEAIGEDWATAARGQNAFSTAKLGRWVYVLESAINDRYHWMQQKKNTLKMIS